MLISLCVITLPVISQQSAATAPADVIQQAITDQTPAEGKKLKPLPFSRLVAVSIALEQSHGWQSPEADRLRALVANDQSSKFYFACMQKLLADGDTAAAVEIYTTRGMEFPPITEFDKSIKLLSDAGFTLAANTLGALNRDLAKKRIIAWISLPADKRKPVDDFMLSRYPPGNLNRFSLVQIAIGLYFEQPADAHLTEDQYFDFLTWFAKDTGQLTYAVVEHDVASNKPAALRLLRWLITERPDDTVLQHRLVQGIIYGLRCSPPEKAELFQFALDHLQAHHARFLRQGYFAEVARGGIKGEGISLAAFQQSPDKLVAAEGYLAAKDYLAASAIYRMVLNDATAPLVRRLAAWSGLWDADPDLAVAATAPLTDELLRLPTGKERMYLLHWFGGEMGRIAGAITLPLPAGRPLATQPACYATMAASMTKMLTSDPVTCLRLDAGSPSLRFPAAVVYMFAQMGPAANDILVQSVEYLEVPRPGTFHSVGVKPGVAVKLTSPRRGESEEAIADVVKALVAYDRRQGKNRTEMMTPEPPNTTYLTLKAERIAASTDRAEVQQELKNLGVHFTLAISYLDPQPGALRLTDTPPPARKVQLAYLTPMQAAVEQAFQNDLACKNSNPFVTEGLQKAMLAAGNPELLDAIFNLSLTVLDKCVAATGNDAKLKADITNYATALDNRSIWNLKPYAEKLRARYLKTADTP
ncbi:MAG TPA: hypothetical protein VGL77_04910 [Armatimonadota bacterium]